MNANQYRRVRLQAYQAAQELAWPTKTLIAAAFAGMLALSSQLSIPVSWTPVPLTMQVLGVFLIGAYLGPRYSLVSLGIFLAAGAIGLHVFSPSANSYNPHTLWSPDRWQILVPNLAKQTGYTAGYIFGWIGAAALVAAWIKRRSNRLDGPLLWTVIAGLIGLLLAIAFASVFLAQDGTFAGTNSGASYDTSRDALWLFLAAAIVIVPAGALVATRARGNEALNLYLVLLAAIAIIHIPGLALLKLTFGWTWPQAFALGSTVFLPFDALKAGAAVALSLPFIPGAKERQAAAAPETPGRKVPL